jgi:hypothetical protein
MCRDFMQFAACGEGRADPLAINRSRVSQNAMGPEWSGGRDGNRDDLATTGQRCSCITPHGSGVRLAE